MISEQQTLLAAHDYADEAVEALDTGDLDHYAKCAAHVRALIGNIELPEDLAAEVRAGFDPMLATRAAIARQLGLPGSYGE